MKEAIMFALIFGLWMGFLIGILIAHYFHKKNYPPEVKKENPKPKWCLSKERCVNHVCLNFPHDCGDDSRKL